MNFYLSVYFYQLFLVPSEKHINSMVAVLTYAKFDFIDKIEDDILDGNGGLNGLVEVEAATFYRP